MTSWPLNCNAASVAESVLWRRGGAATHRLLTDTPAVPLRFEVTVDAPTDARIGREVAIDPVRGTSRVLTTRLSSPR